MIEPTRVDRPAAPGDPESYFIPAGAGSRHEIFPGVEIRTTAGRGIMLSVVRFEPDSAVAEHAHPHRADGLCSSRADWSSRSGA